MGPEQCIGFRIHYCKSLKTTISVHANNMLKREEEGSTIRKPIVQKFASDHYRIVCGADWQRLFNK